ncbi:MAG TPA: acetyl-CoA acetyltransferase [Sporichthyaceae bacterium]|nr:acetyl-CoA acetyltransferase [Sporichthyaceae bacterium]
MASNGIRDRVAVVAMGCTTFGEHWGRSAEDLLVDATGECLSSGDLTSDQIDAYWLGTMASGMSGLTLSKPLALEYRPVTRVENFCATGSEAFRNACYAVASGAYDVAMAVGVEKLKDSGYSGLVRPQIASDGTSADLTLTAPAAFSMLDPAYCAKYGVDPGTFREAMTHIAWKNHCNGARNPRAQFRKAIPKEKIAASPLVAGRLGVLDCSGVSDGAAAAVIVRAEDAHRWTDRPMYVKGLSLVAGPGSGALDPGYDWTTFPEVVASATDAYRQAGIDDPARQIHLAEVHDCFTPTELVLMEDLGFCGRGEAVKHVLDGAFDLDGRLPVNPDGGLKSFGHPVGASGLRMLFECWLQFRGEAGDRQLPDPRVGLTHNLGGRPGSCVSFVSVVGKDLSEEAA